MATSSELAVGLERDQADRSHALVICYALAVVGALAVEGAASATAGAVACGVLVMALLNQHLVASSRQDESAADGVFLALGLLPLGGVLAVVMPTSQLTPAAWPLLVVSPLLMAVALNARALDLPPASLGLKLGPIWWQVLIGLTGLPLGQLAYGILSPQPLAGGTSIALAVISLAALAFAEELLFRGMLQPILWRSYGPVAIAITSMLSVAVALGAHSLGYGALAGLIAVAFGHLSQRTGSIVGTSTSRALMFISLLIFWPHVLG